MTSVLVPLTSLEAPAPRPPLYGLLGSPEAATRATDVRGWEGGIRLDRYPDDMPSAFDPCTNGTTPKDTPSGSGFSDGYGAFFAYLGDICTTFPIHQVWERWRGKAEAALQARTQWALERQLAWATFNTDMAHFLADADMAYPAGTSAVAPKVALAYLEDYLSQFGVRGVISLTPAVAAYLGHDLTVQGGQLRTSAGTPVIVGQGYEGTDAENLDPSGSGAEAAAGRSWIFAHAPVVFQTGELILDPTDLRDAVDRDDNTVVFRAEQALWVGFDGDLGHAGVLANWSA